MTQLEPTTIPPLIYEMHIRKLRLPVRILECLMRSGFTKVGQILEMNDDDLLAVRNVGPKTLDEVHEALNQFRKRWMQRPHNIQILTEETDTQ